MNPQTAEPSIKSNVADGLRWSGRDWVALALLAALVAIFFWRILTPNLADRASFPPGDFAHQFWAFATLEARELAAGRLPLWNPYTYSGAPFWADIQSAVLYPLSLLTVWLGGRSEMSLYALEVEAIGHFWLAGAFTYLFARRITRRRDAALLGAVTFAFGGYLTGYPSQQLAVLEANVWLPLILYCLDRALVDRAAGVTTLRPSPRIGWLLAGGLAWGLTLLAGHPQSALLAGYAFTAYLAFVALCVPRSSPVRNWRLRGLECWAIVVLVGLGLSAVAWLPGLEYMQLSVRAAGFYDKMAGGFPLYDTLQMLLPGSVSFYSPLYVGILPLLLALWAALILRSRETMFWGGVALVALLLSFGGETFLYSPFYLFVPGFSIFRDQERFAFLVSLALAVLTAYGFAGYTQRTSGPADRPAAHPGTLRVVGWLLVGSIGLILLFFYGLNAAGWQTESPFYALLGRSVWLTIILALVWGLARTRERHTVLMVAGCVVLVVLDLFTANWQTNVHLQLPEEQTVAPPVVQAIRNDAPAGQLWRAYNEYRVYENYGVPFEIEDTWGASPLRLARYDALHRSLRMERVWELLNVKYVITWRHELYAPSQIIYQEPAGKDVTYVHRLDTPAPRAWLVHHVEEVGDDGTLARLDDQAFDPLKSALVSPGASPPLGQPATGESGRVDVVEWSPGSLVLRVANPADGLLVLSEVEYPGWRAYLDGAEVGVLRVNYILRGVAVPAGEHQVDLIFRPPTLIWGSAISALTLGAITLAAVLLRRRGR
jgi:hypothetical protein